MSTSSFSPGGARAPRRQRLLGAAILLTALLVALGATVGILSFNRQSREGYRAQVLLARTAGLTHRLIGLERQAEAEQMPQLAQEVRDIQGQMARALDELAQLDDHGATSRRVVAANREYEAAIAELFRLFVVGPKAEADAWDDARVEPSYDRLLDLIAEASATYHDRAQRLDRIADLGTVLVMVMATTLAGTLCWCWQRERARLERRLAHQAFHDALTGLPNRAHFREHLDGALARATRHGDVVAVLFLDLDGFKDVNDSLGHDAGDRLLVAVAGRLRACLRPEDTAARLGGDEFTVLLDGAVDVCGAILVAERLAQALRAPFMLAGREVFVTASIGVVVNTPATGYQSPDELLRDADSAMYRAKGAGKARYMVFEAGLEAGAVTRLDQEATQRHAVERGGFVLTGTARCD